MTTVPEPERPFRVAVTPRRVEELRHCVEELRHLADNAERYANQAALHNDDNSYEEGYGQAVCDVLRWLAFDEPTDDLAHAVADHPLDTTEWRKVADDSWQRPDGWSTWKRRDQTWSIRSPKGEYWRVFDLAEAQKLVAVLAEPVAD